MISHDQLVAIPIDRRNVEGSISSLFPLLCCYVVSFIRLQIDQLITSTHRHELCTSAIDSQRQPPKPWPVPRAINNNTQVSVLVWFLDLLLKPSPSRSHISCCSCTRRWASACQHKSICRANLSITRLTFIAQASFENIHVVSFATTTTPRR